METVIEPVGSTSATNDVDNISLEGLGELLKKNAQPVTDAVAMIDIFCHIFYPQDNISDELRLINHLIKQQLDNFTNLSKKDKPLKISPYKMKIGVQTGEYLNQVFHKGQTTIDPSNYEKIYQRPSIYQ